MDDIEKIRRRLTTNTLKSNFATIFAGAVKRKPYIIKKGTLIFNEGDPLERLYLIKQGYVKLYRLSIEGRETVAYLLGPDNIIGVRSLLAQDECAAHSAETLTDVTVITMSHTEYFKLVANHPEYLGDLVQIFIDRLIYTERKLEGFIFSSTTVRVANFLTDCAKRFGVQKGTNIAIPIELTHQLIAEFVGAFRETVTISLHALEQQNIIRLKRGHIVIHDIKKLKDFALLGKSR